MLLLFILSGILQIAMMIVWYYVGKSDGFRQGYLRAAKLYERIFIRKIDKFIEDEEDHADWWKE